MVSLIIKVGLKNWMVNSTSVVFQSPWCSSMRDAPPSEGTLRPCIREWRVQIVLHGRFMTTLISADLLIIFHSAYSDFPTSLIQGFFWRDMKVPMLNNVKWCRFLFFSFNLRSSTLHTFSRSLWFLTDYRN